MIFDENQENQATDPDEPENLCSQDFEEMVGTLRATTIGRPLNQLLYAEAIRQYLIDSSAQELLENFICFFFGEFHLEDLQVVSDLLILGLPFWFNPKNNYTVITDIVGAIGVQFPSAPPFGIFRCLRHHFLIQKIP